MRPTARAFLVSNCHKARTEPAVTALPSSPGGVASIGTADDGATETGLESMGVPGAAVASSASAASANGASASQSLSASRRRERVRMSVSLQQSLYVRLDLGRGLPLRSAA